MIINTDDLDFAPVWEVLRYYPVKKRMFWGYCIDREDGNPYLVKMLCSEDIEDGSPDEFDPESMFSTKEEAESESLRKWGHK